MFFKKFDSSEKVEQIFIVIFTQKCMQIICVTLGGDKNKQYICVLRMFAKL